MSVSVRLSRPEPPSSGACGWPELGHYGLRCISVPLWASVSLHFGSSLGLSFPPARHEGMEALGGARRPGCAVRRGEDPCQPS